MLKTYSASDVAEAIGVTLDTLYRTRQLRHTRDRLPRPISEVGRLKWECSGFDAWLTRFHPLRPQSAANDLIPQPAPSSIEEHQADLHNYYRQMAAAPH